MAEKKMGGRTVKWELSCTRKRGVATRGKEWWEDSWTRTTEYARRGRGEWKGSRIRKWEDSRTTARKQIEVSSRKNSIGKNADALAFKEINRSLLKVDKSQKIGKGTFGNCYIALYRNEYRVVAKEMKIIESPKKTRGSVARSIGNHWNWRPLGNPSSVWCFHRSGTILSGSPVPSFA